MPTSSFNQQSGARDATKYASFENSPFNDPGKLNKLTDSFKVTKTIFIDQQKIHEKSLLEVQEILAKVVELSSVVSGFKNSLLSDNNKVKSGSSRLTSNYSKRLQILGDFLLAHKNSVLSAAAENQSPVADLVSVRSETPTVILNESRVNLPADPVEALAAKVVGMNAKTRAKMANIAKLRQDIENLLLLKEQSKAPVPGKFALLDDSDDDGGDVDAASEPYEGVIHGHTNNSSILKGWSNQPINPGRNSSLLSQVNERRAFRRAVWTSAASNLSYQKSSQIGSTGNGPVTNPASVVLSSSTASSLRDSVYSTASSSKVLVSPGAIIVKSSSDARSWLHVERCVTVDTTLPDTPDAISQAIRPPRKDWETFDSPLRSVVQAPLPPLTFLPPSSPGPPAGRSTGAGNSAFHMSSFTDKPTDGVTKSPMKPIIRKPSPSRTAADRSSSTGSDGGILISGDGGLDEQPRSRKHSVSGDPVPSSPSYSNPGSPHGGPSAGTSSRAVSGSGTITSSPNETDTKKQIQEEIYAILLRYYEEEPDLRVRKTPAETRELVKKDCKNLQEGIKLLLRFSDKHKNKFNKYITEKYRKAVLGDKASPVLQSQPPTASTASPAGTSLFSGAALPPPAKDSAAVDNLSAGIALTQSKTTTASETVPSIAAQVEQQIREIFTEHNPGKLNNIPDLMQKSRGNEIALLRRVEEKYKVPEFVPKTPTATTDAAPASNIASGGTSLFRSTAVSSGSPTPFSKGATFGSPSQFGTAAGSPSLFQSTQTQTQSQAQTQAPAFGTTNTGSLFTSKQNNVAPGAFGSSSSGSLFGGLAGSAGVASGTTPNASTSSFGQPVPSNMAGLFASPSGNSLASAANASGSSFNAGVNVSVNVSGNISGNASGIPLTPPGAVLSVPEITLKLRNIYTKCEPNKLANIPTLLTKYAGKEMELLRKVEKTYLIDGGKGAQAASPSQPFANPGSSLFGGGGNSSGGGGGGSASLSNQSSFGVAGLFGGSGGSGSMSNNQPRPPSSLFGGSPSQSQSNSAGVAAGSGAFGTAGGAGAWGAPSRGSSSALFGSPSPLGSSNMSGVGAGPGGGAFGQSPGSATGFGTRTASLFSSPSQSSQQQQQPGQSTMFGNTSQPGTSSLFGGTSQRPGSTPLWGTR